MGLDILDDACVDMIFGKVLSNPSCKIVVCYDDGITSAMIFSQQRQVALILVTLDNVVRHRQPNTDTCVVKLKNIPLRQFTLRKRPPTV